MSTLSVNTITDASGGNTAKINTYTPTESNMMGKNRIINGDMRIDQRNAGASVTPSAGSNYTLDRWQYQADVGSKASVQRNAGSVTPPVGFTNYLGVTSLSAYTAGTNEQYNLSHYIEGFNVADLGWGTANASTVTLSFWVRSSLTGTFSGALTNSAGNRSYAFTFTVTSANTWTQASITIVGDTTGSWATDNSTGISVKFNLGSGSGKLKTAGSWGTGDVLGATGSVAVVATNGATFYITGVQLEVGSVATPFERRPYGQELALCQRYYQKLQASSADSVWNTGFCEDSAILILSVPFITQMRAAPSSLEQSGTAGDYRVRRAASNHTCTSVLAFQGASTFSMWLLATVASGLTAGQAASLRAVNTNAFLAWSAEL
jgi:hypothetical protein